MSLKRLAIIVALLKICFSAAVSLGFNEMRIYRSMDALGGDMNSTFIKGVGDCITERDLADDLSSGYYRFCFSVTFKQIQTTCNTIAYPGGAVVYKTQNEDWSKYFYCTSWTSATAPSGYAPAEFDTCKKVKADAVELMNISRRQSKQVNCRVHNLDN